MTKLETNQVVSNAERMRTECAPRLAVTCPGSIPHSMPSGRMEPINLQKLRSEAAVRVRVHVEVPTSVRPAFWR
jgi:hypothetical protein